MEVPSGRILDAFDVRILQLFASYGFVRWHEKPLTLNSGIESHVYIHGREDVTDNQDLEWLLGRKIAYAVLGDAAVHRDGKRQCLIGIPVAGTTLAHAAAMVSFQQQRIFMNPEDKPWISHRLMREVIKTHGAHQSWVDGVHNPDFTYWIVDNVITDGASKIRARDRLVQSGYPGDMPTFILVDRQQGGVERLQKAGFHRIVVGFNLLDITYVYGKLGLWPRDAAQAVQEEIEAHQFVS